MTHTTSIRISLAKAMAASVFKEGRKVPPTLGRLEDQTIYGWPYDQRLRLEALRLSHYITVTNIGPLFLEFISM